MATRGLISRQPVRLRPGALNEDNSIPASNALRRVHLQSANLA